MKTKKAFKEYLNALNDPNINPHQNGRFKQIKRLYGDYLYHQDRVKFNVLYEEWK